MALSIVAAAEGKSIMIKIILVLVGFLTLCYVVLMSCLIILSRTEKQIKKKDAEYNHRQKETCKLARNTQVCPGKCTKCTYALRMYNGKIYSLFQGEKHESESKR